LKCEVSIMLGDLHEALEKVLVGFNGSALLREFSLKLQSGFDDLQEEEQTEN
jgi:hypothetical protein